MLRYFYTVRFSERGGTCPWHWFIPIIGLMLFVIAASPVAAQTKQKVIVGPLDLIGKTQSQCERILGKPAYTEKNTYYYKAPFPGITRIILSTWPISGQNETIPPHVTRVDYHFPKTGNVKTWQDAATLVGVRPARLASLLGQVMSGPLQEMSIDGRTDFRAFWTSAEDSLKLPPAGQHAKDHDLGFLKTTEIRISP